MSFPFNNYTPTPFNGSPTGLPVGVCMPSTFPPKTVAIVIDWTKYPTNCVLVDMNASGIINPLDKIRSVIVDNLTNYASVIVNFPDIGFNIVTAPDSNVSGVALTNQLKFFVFRSANASSITAGSMQTTIFVCNFLVDTYSQENISQSVTLGASTGLGTYAPFALGDLHAFQVVLMSTTAPTYVMFGSPQLNKQFRITKIQMRALGLYSEGFSQQAAAIGLCRNTTTDIVFVGQMIVPNNLNVQPNYLIFDSGDIQTPLDGGNTYFLKNLGNTMAGQVQVDIWWTTIG